MEADIRKHEAEKQALLDASSSRDRGTLLVSGTIYPGVKVIFGDRMVLFRKDRKGPVRIERRLVDRVEEICVIDCSSGSATTLISYEYQPAPETPDKPGKTTKTDKKR